MKQNVSKSERVRGGFWGLLVGDALGVPYEFHSPDHLPPLDQIEFYPPKGFPRTYPNLLPGTWSDDGAQALCLLDSLLACGKMDPQDFADRLFRWYEQGYMAVDGEVFDVGVQTSAAIRAFRAGTPALEAGFVLPEGKGNGSLMRVLPLALWHRGTDAELVEDAHLQSMVTHGHPCNQVCCALYCLWIRRVLGGMPTAGAYRDAVYTLREIYSEGSSHWMELEHTVRPEDEPESDGNGYVVTTINSVRLSISKGSYEQVVKAAVALGRDTDTNAAVAGGLAGVRDGVSAIPDRWLNSLRGKELARPLLERLLEIVV